MRNKFTRTYSSLIFSLITISIFSYYAIRPAITTILSLQKSITEQSQVLVDLKSKVNDLVQGKKSYEEIPAETKTKLNSLIPDNPNLTQVINGLTFAAKESGATVSGIQFQPVDLTPRTSQVSKNAQVNQVEFTFNTQGEFPNLMKMLDMIKRLDRLIAISSVNFTQPLDGPLVLSLTGKAYYLKN